MATELKKFILKKHELETILEQLMQETTQFEVSRTRLTTFIKDLLVKLFYCEHYTTIALCMLHLISYFI